MPIVVNIAKEVTAWPTIVGTLADCMTALATAAIAISAIMGIDTWKKQTKANIAYELARRYLRAVYKIRDSLKDVRNPFISISEQEESLKKQGLDEKKPNNFKETNRAVYSTRWQKVSEAISDLEVELREAEIIWGKEAVLVEKEFDGLIRKLRATVIMFLRGELKDIKGLFEIYDSGEGDTFNAEMDKAINKIEKYLEPHLNLR